MANDINSITIVGRLTRDPELRNVGQNSVCSFSIAVGKTFVSNGAKKEETSFFEIECWGKLAEIIKQYANKGRQVCISGELKQDSWKTPDGKTASKVKIIADRVQLIGTQGNNSDMQTGLTQTVETIVPDTEDKPDDFIF